MRVGQISGNNFQSGIKRGNADYYFSVYNHIWGWASWADRWKNYDFELNTINNTKFIEVMFNERYAKKYWLKIFKRMKNKAIDTWDYQWTFILLNHKQITILPNVNLIENVGFGVNATHTTSENELAANLKSSEIVLKKHPKDVLQNIDADNFTEKTIFSRGIIFYYRSKFTKYLPEFIKKHLRKIVNNLKNNG